MSLERERVSAGERRRRQKLPPLRYGSLLFWVRHLCSILIEFDVFGGFCGCSVRFWGNWDMGFGCFGLFVVIVDEF